jgi:hypothetical protein
MKLGPKNSAITVEHKIKALNIRKGQVKFGSRIISSSIGEPRYVLTGLSPGGGKVLADVAGAAAAGVLQPIDSTAHIEQSS